MSGTHVTANIHVDTLDNVSVQVFETSVWIGLGGPSIFLPSSSRTISDRLDGIEAFANIILERVDAARQAQVVAS